MGAYTYLHQEFEAGDALEGQDEEGPEGKSLTQGATLQSLHTALEARILVPDHRRAR